jgi:hypothetical protein
MSKEINRWLVFGIVVVMAGWVLEAESGEEREMKQEKFYTAPPYTSSEPNSAPPEWTISENGVITLERNAGLSIGIRNQEVPWNNKLVKICLKRISRSDPSLSNITLGAPRGYKEDGSSVTATMLRKLEQEKEGGEDYYASCKFDPQPDYEIFQIYNGGNASARTFIIEVFTGCAQVRKISEAIKNAEESRLVIESMYVFYPGTTATVEIDKVAIWHEQKTASDGSFTPPVETGSWDKLYISEDPDPNDLPVPLPGGGWLWSCQPDDRGIWETENFGLSLTTTTLAGGSYWVVWHDRLRDRWVRFLFQEEEITYLRGDLNQDQLINLVDFGLFAGRWLEETCVLIP